MMLLAFSSFSIFYTFTSVSFLHFRRIEIGHYINCFVLFLVVVQILMLPSMFHRKSKQHMGFKH